MRTTTAAGSLEALVGVLERGALALSGEDVVVLVTASAFVGAEAAAIEVATRLEPCGVRVEALMNLARASSDEPYFARRIGEADLVVLSDGSPLHARSVWRASLVGDALSRARAVAAIGSVASVLGPVMIDPRGGAPTNGLGYVEGLVIAVAASDAQLARTRGLLAADATLAVLGPSGVVHHDGRTWRALSGEVVATRAGAPVVL